MTKDYTTGIDIGTDTIKIVMTNKKNEKESQIHIAHAIESMSHGFRHGYITDSEAAFRALRKALRKAEAISKSKIEEAHFSIAGIGLSSKYIRTNIDINSKDKEISSNDIDDLIVRSEELFSKKYPNKKILHIIPVKYLVDDEQVLGSPIGMYGGTLEAQIIFITIPEHHYDAFISLIQKTGVTIADLVAAPLANAESSASARQKSQGCIITNIGSETTSMASFENGIITSLEVTPIGSNDITNDIALGLQTSLEIAENVKNRKNKEFPQRKVDEIIHARISDILDGIEHHLKSIKKSRLLPAGVIYTGGGSQIEHLEKYTRVALQLPAERVVINKLSTKTKRNTDIGPQFSVAYGLCSINSGYEASKNRFFDLKKIKKTISKLISQITP